MRYYVKGIDRKTKTVCDKTKERKIPILLSAFYSTPVNLLISTTSHFTLPKLSLSHVTCSSHHTYFQTFLSNMRLSPFH